MCEGQKPSAGWRRVQPFPCSASHRNLFAGCICDPKLCQLSAAADRNEQRRAQEQQHGSENRCSQADRSITGTSRQADSSMIILRKKETKRQTGQTGRKSLCLHLSLSTHMESGQTGYNRLILHFGSSLRSCGGGAGDFGLLEAERLEVLEILQVRQAGVGDLGQIEVQASPGWSSCRAVPGRRR